MALKRKMSFNQAWRDFLLLRPFTRAAQITITRDAEKKVVDIKVGAFKQLDEGTEQYVIDDVSCSGIILAYPRKIVEDAVKEKIFDKLIGKPLSDERMEQVRNKLAWDTRKTASRLGCLNNNEIQQAMTERNFWEVLFSLHQLIEYRLRRLLLCKCSKVDTAASEITVDSSMENFCDRIRTFKHLVEIGYLLGALNYKENIKSLSFNAERHSIAHKLLISEITDELLETACNHGVEVLNGLENAFQRIVPKPKMIMMNSFLIHEFLD